MFAFELYLGSGKLEVVIEQYNYTNQKEAGLIQDKHVIL
jgi:hypothetical protein